MVAYSTRRLVAGVLQLSVLMVGLWLLVNYAQPCLNRAPRGIIVDPWICLKPAPLSWVDMIGFALFVLIALFLAERLTKPNLPSVPMDRRSRLFMLGSQSNRSNDVY